MRRYFEGLFGVADSHCGDVVVAYLAVSNPQGELTLETCELSILKEMRLITRYF